jgi:hypothetical protein
MENSLVETRPESDSFSSFINRIQSTAPGSDPENGSPVTGAKNARPVPNQSSTGGSAKADSPQGQLPDTKEDSDPFDSLLTGPQAKLAEFKQDPPTDEESAPFLSSFLIELIHSTKASLASIFNTTLLTIERLEDAELKKYSQNSVKEEIRKIDMVLNSLLNFININTPIVKTNTLNLILEEVLEANEKQIQDKNIKVFKKCEKDLPETFIHHEQVRFVLHSILQYSLLSASPNETIGLFIRPSDFRNRPAEQKTKTPDRGGFVDVIVGFKGDNKIVKPSENPSDASAFQKREPTHLILKLVEEILQKNRGMMKLAGNGTNAKTVITLRFPVERRKVVFYEPIQV